MVSDGISKEDIISNILVIVRWWGNRLIRKGIFARTDRVWGGREEGVILTIIMGKVGVLRDDDRWMGRYSIGEVMLQKKRLEWDFKLWHCVALLEEIDCATAEFGENFEVDVIRKREGKELELPEYRGQNCVSREWDGILCWWRRGWNRFVVGLKVGILVWELGMGKIGFSWEFGRLVELWKDGKIVEWKRCILRRKRGWKGSGCREGGRSMKDSREGWICSGVSFFLINKD